MTELKKKVIAVNYPGTDVMVQKRVCIEEEDGTVGQFHSFDGEPAYECYYKNGDILRKLWYDNGELHRVEGPASITWTEGDPDTILNQSYFWQGKCIDKDIEDGTIVLEEDGSIPEHAQFTLALAEDN